MPDTIDRPLWRAFAARELSAAARHAKAGGLAVLKGERWSFFGDAGPAGEDVPLYVDWAIRAIEATRWEEVTEGPARGLVTATIKRNWHARVDEWIARDAAFPGATAKTTFDCMRCAACCYDNEVLLLPEDLLRFTRGGRDDLARRTRLASPPKKKGAARGRLLPLDRKTKACIHLAPSLLCSIYEVRPFMCRDFPFGTEQCMTSREDLYGSPFPEGR